MKKVSAEDFFTPEEQERIRRGVEAAEGSTAGEIATMVVAQSDGYCEAGTLASVLGAASAALLVAIVSGHVTIWSYLPVVMILYLPVRWLVSVAPAFKRPFIATARLNEAVKERAVRAFYEKRLYRTRHETGILIFISIFERKVWILGDRGINARIAPESWQLLVQTLTTGIREGRAADALCEVIRRCGEELSLHFPRETDDMNELRDEVLTGQ